MSNDKPLILLVDDDLDFIEINRHILQAAGFEVAASHDTAEALEMMAKRRPDLVISDLMMKALDSGFSFCKRIKEDPHFASVPVVLVTSVSSQCGFDFHPQGPDDLAAMHIDAFLDKPVPAKTLLAKVRELLKLPER